MKNDKQMEVAALIFGCAALLTALSVVIVSGYSFCFGDDFVHANAVGAFGEGIAKLFAASVIYAKKMYLTWQGTYTSMFLQAFLSSLNGFGDLQLRIVMVVNSMLVIASLGVFVHAVCKSLGADSDKKEEWIVFSLCVIGIFGITSWGEVFNWFSGAVSYSFPLSLCFLGLSLSLCARSAKGSAMGSVLMFLASGGTLAVAGTGCMVLLGICVVKKISGSAAKRNYMTFAVAVLGALLNTIAPGNYVRYAVIDSTGIHVKPAVIMTVSEVFETTKELLTNPLVLLIICTAVLIGARMSKEKRSDEWKVLAVLLALCIITPFVTCFPVCLAFNVWIDFPNRCKFLETTVLILAFILFSGIVGYVLREQIGVLHQKQKAVALVLVLLIAFGIKSSWSVSQTAPWQMWNGIAQESYKTYREEVNAIYKRIEEDSNENVFIYNRPEAVTAFPEMYLSEKMIDGFNLSIATYYHKLSVQCVTQPLAVQDNGQKFIRISPETFGGQSGYISGVKTDNRTGETELVWELWPLDSNLLFSLQSDEMGEMTVSLFADSGGREWIDEIHIYY